MYLALCEMYVVHLYYSTYTYNCIEKDLEMLETMIIDLSSCQDKGSARQGQRKKQINVSSFYSPYLHFTINTTSLKLVLIF